MVKHVGIAKKFGLSLIWLPLIYKKWNMKIFYKIFDRQLGGFSIENLTHPLKSENFMMSNHRHVGCPYIEARGWNVGAVCSDLHLDECIWRKSPKGTLFGPITERAKIMCVWGFFYRYTHPNANLSTQRQHSSLLPLDGHPTCLWLDIMKFSLFNGWVKFSIENPPS